MSNEARITASLEVKKANGWYQSYPTSFLANVSVFNGPTPGTITATTAGTVVNLSQLAQPGLYCCQNLDVNNPVELGIYDNSTGKFYPFHLLLPGESYPGRLSDLLGHEIGTGTHADVGTTSVMVRAKNASCFVRFDAFDT